MRQDIPWPWRVAVWIVDTGVPMLLYATSLLVMAALLNASWPVPVVWLFVVLILAMAHGWETGARRHPIDW